MSQGEFVLLCHQGVRRTVQDGLEGIQEILLTPSTTALHILGKHGGYFEIIISSLSFGACIASGTRAIASVTITSPSNGSTVSSPVQLIATSQGSRNVSSMSVYANGSLVFQNFGQSSIDTSLTLNPGTYSIVVQAESYSSRGSSATVTITIPANASTGSSSVASQIAADMQGSNEGNPDGVPLSYDWANGPIIGLGNNFAPQAALEWWGALFTGPNGNPAVNTLVNVRAVSLYILSKSTGIWTAYSFPYSQISSDIYSADFTVDYGTSVPMRQESDGSFSFSVTAGNVSHFYAPYPRVSVNPNDIGGIVALMEARLILKNANGTDDRSTASYLLGSALILIRLPPAQASRIISRSAMES